MDHYSLKWPDDFEDYSWEIEAKGWFTGVQILFGDKVFTPVFYDRARLEQEIGDAIASQKYFAETRLVVVDRVSRASIEDSISAMAEAGELLSFFNC